MIQIICDILHLKQLFSRLFMLKMLNELESKCLLKPNHTLSNMSLNEQKAHVTNLLIPLSLSLPPPGPPIVTYYLNAP